MPIIEWSGQFETGAEEIDDQHKSLFKAVNDFHQAILDGVSQENILSTLDFLIDYTVQHFRSEEAFMEEINYPKLNAHKKMHAHLIDTVNVTMRKIENKEKVYYMEFLVFLSDWLTDHIQKHDFEITQYMRANNIADPIKSGSKA